MSVKERRRSAWFVQVKEGRASLSEAARQTGLSYRQALRLWKRYKERGDAGLVHRLRGRAGNHRTGQAIRRRAVSLYAERYGDFGATLACEYLLEKHKLKVDDQTLRRWLTAEGLWRRRRKACKNRSRRERRGCFGELVQIDGSHHDWFEGRRGPCVAMVMVDDATNRTWVRFSEGETTDSAMGVVERWAKVHGLPRGLYPDRHSIYRVNTKEAEQEYARTGKRPLTQFTRAMGELGVSVTCANSPQAKGRVERMNGTLQDRLVKALRIAGIDTIEAANGYVEGVFLPDLNERFTVPPASPVDAHVAVSEAALEAALCIRQERRVGKDQCVSWEGRVLQLRPAGPMGSLANKKVTVERSLAGDVRVVWHGVVVEHEAVAQRPEVAAATPTLAQRLAGHQPAWKPPADHPWKKARPGGTNGDSRLRPCSAPACSPTARKPPLRKTATARG